MNLLLAEWTKLRSVPRWVITLFAAALLTVGISLLGASSSNSDINAHPNFVTGPNGDPVSDSFAFAHQPASGDVTLTARVASLGSADQRPAGDDSGKHGDRVPETPWTGMAAGIMIKNGIGTGSSYVAVLLTSTNGVRMQSDFAEDVAGSPSRGTRWLRLTRTGNAVTGYESADGVTWQPIATMTPASVPANAAIGLYVSSAPAEYLSRGMGSSSLGWLPTSAAGTFDNVRLTAGGAGTWQADQVMMPQSDDEDEVPSGEVPPKPNVPPEPRTVLTESSGTYTLNGQGKVGPQAPDDDVVSASLLGVIAGLMALIAVGVLFATSEFRKGMIRTTFTATPRRGRVLAAKAVVLGGVTFVLSLIAVTASFLLALPVLQDHGMAPPAFPTPSLVDGPVLRALVLAALFMTGVTLFALALGTLLRHSAAAITLTIVLLVLPVIAGAILPGTTPRLLMYTTLAGGLATLRAKPPTETLAEPWALISPGAGVGVIAAYAVIGLGLAWWQLRRRDA